jgi:DNA polymerase-1
MLVTGKMTCPICLTVASLPDSLPFGQDVCCSLCRQLLKRYLPCVACELAFNPDLPGCPTCGVRPPDEAYDSTLYKIPDRVVFEAIAKAREIATSQAPTAASPAARAVDPAPAPRAEQARAAAPAMSPPEKPANQAPAKRTNGNGSNGRSNGAGRRTAALADLPELTMMPPALADDENGTPVEGQPLAPGLQASTTVHSVTGEDHGALFEVAGPEVASSTLTINAEFELITEQARLAEVVAELTGQPIVAVDTETTGLDPFADNALLLVQVATPDRAYLIDSRKVDPRPLRRILEDDRTLKLLQNAKFDYKMLRFQAGISMRRMYDTMLAERVLTAGISREIGLAKLAKKYAGVTLDKSVRTSFIDKTGEFSYDQLRYAARDALVLFTIYAQQREMLKREKMLEVALLEFQTVIAVGEMELAGCMIDQQRWRKIIDSAQAERDRTANELGELLADAIPQQSLFGGPAINLNSNAQLLETFGRMGLVLPDTMEATLQKYDHPAIKKLLEYRGFEKMLSAFGEKFLELIHKKTGRIHPDFNQLGADTGRFSCTNPNVQQIPATSDFRACFVASPGYKLITCDYSQAELRILAQLSEDPAFVEAFQSGGDLHLLTASQMFQVPPDLVDKKQRSAAKVINFGLAYGRGPAALGVQLGVSTDEAKRLIDQYFKAYSGIQRWLDKAAREAVRKGYSITMLGRKRYYAPIDPDDPDYNKKRSSIERQGKNSPIQGSNADMTKLALIGLHEALQGYDARVVNTVHDEIVVEAREEQAEAVCRIVEHEMVKAGAKIITLVPVVADAKIADYWSK